MKENHRIKKMFDAVGYRISKLGEIKGLIDKKYIFIVNYSKLISFLRCFL